MDFQNLYQELITFISHHYITSLLWVVLLVYLVYLQICLWRDNIKSVNNALMSVMSAHDDASILDVRSDADYENGHIAGSQRFSIKEIETCNIKTRFNDKSIVIVGSGYDDETAYNCAKALKKAGLKNTFLLSGGMLEWNSKNLPTVK